MSTNSAIMYVERLANTPEGYELCLESEEPIWFGPWFERESFAQWTPDGFRVTAMADGGRFMESMTLELAKEVHRQLAGVLTLMGELPAAV
jgi:hypothetical protein